MLAKGAKGGVNAKGVVDVDDFMFSDQLFHGLAMPNVRLPYLALVKEHEFYDMNEIVGL